VESLAANAKTPLSCRCHSLQPATLTLDRDWAEHPGRPTQWTPTGLHWLEPCDQLPARSVQRREAGLRKATYDAHAAIRQLQALPLGCPTSLRTLAGSNRHSVLTSPVLQPRLRSEYGVPVLALKVHEPVCLCRAGSVRRGT